MIEKDFPDGERSRRWLSGAETTLETKPLQKSKIVYQKS